MNPDGSDVRVIPLDAGHNMSPAWSPDGRRIAFVSIRTWQGEGKVDNWDIYVVNVDGTELRRLTTYHDVDRHPTWSPDGTQIAFERLLLTPRGQFDIFVMNADGTNERNITNDPSDDLYPSWCPVPLATAVSPEGKTPLLWAQLKRAGH